MQIKELGHVVLYVTDLIRMADFYRDTLGFNEIAHNWPMALFSSGRTHHELLLIEVGGVPRTGINEMRPGLYHIGLKIGDGERATQETYEELQKKGVRIVGTADHGITHSIYVLDPDGNELELYADIGDAWKHDPTAILAQAKPLHFR